MSKAEEDGLREEFIAASDVTFSYIGDLVEGFNKTFYQSAACDISDENIGEIRSFISDLNRATESLKVLSKGLRHA